MNFCFRDYSLESDKIKSNIDKKFQLMTFRYEWFDFEEHYTYYESFTNIPPINGKYVLSMYLNIIYIVDNNDMTTIYCYFEDTSLYNKRMRG